MKSELLAKTFPIRSYNCRELWICREIPALPIFVRKCGRFLTGAREYKMLPLMMPGVIFEVVPLLMPLLLFTVLTSANLPLESIRILLE